MNFVSAPKVVIGAVAAIALFSLSSPLSQAAETAGNRPMIEIGIAAGGANDITPVASGSTFAGMVSADARFNLLFMDAQAEFISFAGPNGGFTEDYSLRANGGLFFAKVHEFYMRKNPNGDHMHAMAGFGSSYDLPGNVGTISASLGAMIMNWERGDTSKELVGGYGGVNLYMHIWKFENELRIAYYAAPKLDIKGAVNGLVDKTVDNVVDNAVSDATGNLPTGGNVNLPNGGSVTTPGSVTDAISGGNTSSNDGSSTAGNTNGAALITGWSKGLMLSNTLRFNMISIPMFRLGPQVQFSMMQMPDGTEFVTTVGFGGRFGL